MMNKIRYGDLQVILCNILVSPVGNMFSKRFYPALASALTKTKILKFCRQKNYKILQQNHKSI